MRVLYVTAGEIPSVSGPYGSQAVSLIEYLNDTGLATVGLLAGFPAVSKANLSPRSAVAAARMVRSRIGADFFLFPLAGSPRAFMYPGSRREDRAGRGVGRSWAKRAYESFRPEIVHCRSYSAARLALAWRKHFGWQVPIAFDARSHGPEEAVLRRGWSIDSPEYRLARALELDLLKEADVTIALSAPMLRYFNSVGAQRSALVRTIVDTRATAPKSASPNRVEKFCYTGLLQSGSWHDPMPLFGVFNAIVRVRPSATMTIVTRSPHQPLIDLAESEFPDIAHRVTLMSAPDANAVMGIVRGVDAGIQTLSYPESTAGHRFARSVIGTKVAEYICAGLPVLVGSGCEAAAEVVRDNNVGIAIAGGSEIDLSDLETLDRLSSDPDRISSVGRQLFGIENAAPEYVRIYESLL